MGDSNNQMTRHIQTGDGVWREETAEDRLRQAMWEVEQARKKSNRTEDIDWKLLKGINNNLYES